MLAIGVALIVGGAYWLLTTLIHARSEADVARSDERDQTLRREFGIFSSKARQVEWVYRRTYEHPVLMRVPGCACIATGIFLIVLAVR
ncbi:MAG: hypothetical protein MUE36_10505 [Acidimicrobiales bacterium]|jgi:hypothetical protein|nr:hypothetical protein [Acidimicrobiales bacterium]